MFTSKLGQPGVLSVVSEDSGNVGPFRGCVPISVALNSETIPTKSSDARLARLVRVGNPPSSPHAAVALNGPALKNTLPLVGKLLSSPLYRLKLHSVWV